jgi:hypothetical protein
MLSGSDEWTFFLANPEPTVLICATDRSFLHRVLHRSDGKGAGRALPESLAEWHEVDVKAPVWGMRHYRKEQAAKDPTSPLRSRTEANVCDPQAIGFVFWYDDRPAAANAITARYLSNSPNAMQIATDGWKREKDRLTPKVSQIVPGVVEMSLSHDDEDGWRPFHRVIWEHLGHVIVK